VRFVRMGVAGLQLSPFETAPHRASRMSRTIRALG